MSGWLCPDWPAPSGIGAAVTTRWLRGGISQPPFEACNLSAVCGDAPTAVVHNRQRLLAELALPAMPRWLRQVHGTAVHDADICEWTATEPGEPPPADAAVAREPGRVLAILSADCLPVLFCAQDASEIGAVHAGWRGLAAGVLEATVAQLQTPPEQLLAWLGPCIGRTSYEVGEEVRAAFLTLDPQAYACFVVSRPGHWFCDLAALARQRLARAGVGAVYGGDFDTATDRRFYSYRRDRGETGRFASLIWRI